MLYQRYWMEALGTFLLTCAINFGGIPFAIGGMLTTIIMIGAAVSGAHYNGAISCAIFLQKRLSSAICAYYIIAQVTGATAALLLFAYINKASFLPETLMLPLGLAMSLELLLTFVFCTVIMVCDYLKQNRVSDIFHVALVGGIALMTVAFMGGLCNPSIGIATIVSYIIYHHTLPAWNYILIYTVTPFLASVVSVYAFNYFYHPVNEQSF